jgi:hypothetical protein
LTFSKNRGQVSTFNILGDLSDNKMDLREKTLNARALDPPSLFILFRMNKIGKNVEC